MSKSYDSTRSSKSRIPLRSPTSTPSQGSKQSSKQTSKQNSQLPSKVASPMKLTLTPLVHSLKALEVDLNSSNKIIPLTNQNQKRPRPRPVSGGKMSTVSPTSTPSTKAVATVKPKGSKLQEQINDFGEVQALEVTPIQALSRNLGNLASPKPNTKAVTPMKQKGSKFQEHINDFGVVQVTEVAPISAVLSRRVENFPSARYAFAVETPINLLTDTLLKKIFSYVNHADLILCCSVQKHWYRLITSDPSFFDKTVCVISIRKIYSPLINTSSYNDLTAKVRLPFRHARMQYVDHRFLENHKGFVYKNSDNELYFPDSKFLASLATLEFRSSFLLWHTVKRVLIKAVQLESLTFTNCHVSDMIPPPSRTVSADEFDDYKAGNAVFCLKHLEILEAYQLKGITTILKKIVGYKNQSLVSLKITYQPPEKSKEFVDTEEDSKEFCVELKELITLCVNSLQILILDIHHEPTLDLIGDKISKVLANLGPRMNLKEYQLTLSLGCWQGKPELTPKSDVAMRMESSKRTPEESEDDVKAAAVAIALFLESQKNLEKLAVPCISYPVIYSSEFKLNFSRLPCADKLNFLSVPSAGFLLPEFLDQFPKLRRIKVGGSCCSDYTSGWEIFKLYLKAKERSPNKRKPALANIQNDFFDVVQRQDLALVTAGKPPPSITDHVMERIEELCISSCKIPSNFTLLAENLSGLTFLEVSSPKPVFSDEHMQACIKHLKQLRTLMIGTSDKLTDYGITGIPADSCMSMFQMQRYHKYGVNMNIWSARKLEGRPLSDIKGLRKLVLIGNSKFTDIGIGYGLQFRELKYCHLPYSDYIMEWGIKRLGEMNPSVETLVLSGVNQHCKEAFLELRKTHERLKRGDVSRSGYFVEKKSPICDDFSLVLPPPPAFLAEWYANVAGKISGFVSMFYA